MRERAMQMITALEEDVLVPEQKQQVEFTKTGLDLIRSQMRLIGLQREPDGRRILTVYEGGGNPLWQGFSEPS